MNINQIRNMRNSFQPKQVVNTMEISRNLHAKQPKTIAEKKQIIEKNDKDDVVINSVNDIIKLKPSKKKVREFYKKKIEKINEVLEDNI